jgi:hypothetical protein
VEFIATVQDNLCTVGSHDNRDGKYNLRTVVYARIVLVPFVDQLTQVLLVCGLGGSTVGESHGNREYNSEA